MANNGTFYLCESTTHSTVHPPEYVLMSEYITETVLPLVFVINNRNCLDPCADLHSFLLSQSLPLFLN